jgi:hypothetical protein
VTGLSAYYLQETHRDAALQTGESYPLSPQHDGSLGCGWGEKPTDMNCSHEYIE